MAANVSEGSIPEVDPCSNYTAAWLWLSSLQPTYLSLTSVVGLLGNSLVLCVFCLQRKSCTVADVYLGNLAAADLVMMSCLPFWAITVSQGFRWDFGDVLCKMVNVAISMNYICSILFLVLVSLDRYLALVKPMCPSRLRRAAWARRICLGVWVLGFLLSLPSLLYRTVKYVEDPGVNACILAYPHPSWRVHHNIIRNVLGFLIPVPVVAYCSWHISSVLADGRVSGVPQVRTERKSTYLVLAVLVVFLFCWTPHQAMLFLDTLDYYHVTPGCLWGHVLDVGLQLSTYLAYSNSAVNPFLFVIVGKHFRKRAKAVFWKRWESSRKDTLVSFTPVKRLNESRRISIGIKKMGL